MATQRDDRHRPLPSAQCSLCGIALPTGLMVPDGGQACADIRWYCKDAKSSTAVSQPYRAMFSSRIFW